MENNSITDFIAQYGRYTVRASAVELDCFWFPQYQISFNGMVIAPWQRPAVEGFKDRFAAVTAASQQGMEDIRKEKR